MRIVNLIKLHTELAAMVPIVGVHDDGSIDFQMTATDKDQAAAYSYRDTQYVDDPAWMPPPPPPSAADLKKAAMLADAAVPQSVKDYLALT